MLKQGWSDLRVLYHLLLARKRGNSHAERLESFYRGQAGHYDGFRQRLLQGRRELIESLPWEKAAGGVWVDLGGGTGANLEFAGDRLRSLKAVYLVDLCPSLLEVARERIARHGWQNVHAVEADATAFRPPEGEADLVTFSYSLTMIPDWAAALDHARALLKAEGTLGVVDFYVSRKHEPAPRVRHSWWTRTFWQTWFAFDDVFLSPDHLPYLRHRFQTLDLREERAALPYFPLGRAPYYRFLGQPR